VVLAHDARVIEHVRRAVRADLLRPAEALLETAGVEWESEVVGGDPQRMVVEIIERYQCGAVVMGTHGAGGLRSALLGSVSGGCCTTARYR
jgi:nucleotide-binding universal stress UspA family protein